MVELAEIFRLHGAAYQAQFAAGLLPSHRRAMQDIEDCRTAARGGHLYFCQQCQTERYSYHSCKNRHCPKCQNEQANLWLQSQQQLLLPTHYFLVTFTLPAALRPLARQNQQLVYNLLFRAAAAALLKLAQDPRFVGGLLGMVGVLHTWTRALHYHPHIHFLVTGGGLNKAGAWKAARPDFLVPVKALSRIFRAQFRDRLKATPLFSTLPAHLWRQDWVVHSKPVGSGAAACKYLAPYIFRVAISNNRILKLEADKVTFKYRESATGKSKRAILSVFEFIRRFLQHVLPARFVKVRYYGLLSPANRQLLARARRLLAKLPIRLTAAITAPAPVTNTLLCPHCGGPLSLRATLKPLLLRPP